ncbi:HET-domain-containing protein [Mytilinidion resinicola]|uniref:HET-domain-containing protein n=1 Tax=Mytilinidion resinicola TaxID=574789 RepID=A0A6A6Z7Y7_9PEZI|nr:HET-domain-containing protein [Mytilinidion resinicola]KAF2816918.1 HET-domain-containing protein [Mytilinidion resinicola]
MGRRSTAVVATILTFTMPGKESFLSGGTFCDVFCNTMSTEFSPEDYEEPLRSLSNLRISGDRGCLKCQILYRACVQLHPALEEDASFVLVRLEEHHTVVRVVLGDAEEDRRIVGNQEVHLHYLYKTSPPDWIILYPYRKPSAARRTGFKPVLSEWLNDCDKNHSACKRGNKTLPTRVVNVGEKSAEGYDPFLHISSGEVGQYAALSHCWGKTTFLKTTKSNVTQHQSRIPFTALPINFQHAVIVCRAIGIQYIWIDSLCIIQDDGPDWEIEASRMASIYQNASVVLFASNAADSQGGLWSKKWDKDAAHADGIEEFEYINHDGTRSQIIARKSPSHDTLIPGPYLEYEAPSPLSTRAWAFQEQLLPERSIFFTGKELLWKCQSGQKCECMQEDYEYDTINDLDKDFWERAHSEDAIERFGGWRSLLAIYSRKEITYDSDRLPAISGLAKYMQSRGAGTYLAGVWKEDLLESLIWLPRPVWPDVSEDNMVSTYRKRTSTYRAPTWSWISLETHQDGQAKPKCPGIQDWVENHWRLDVQHAKLIEATCEPIGVDPTGAIKSAYITLKTRCVESLVTWENRRAPIVCGTVKIHGVYWDIDLDVGRKLKILCALIGEGDGFAYLAIVLQPSKTAKGAFERVGLVQTVKGLAEQAEVDLFDDVPEITVKIV